MLAKVTFYQKKFCLYFQSMPAIYLQLCMSIYTSEAKRVELFASLEQPPFTRSKSKPVNLVTLLISESEMNCDEN